MTWQRAHIVFIIADQQGWDSMRYEGKGVTHTSNLDRISGTGTRAVGFQTDGPLTWGKADEFGPARGEGVTPLYPGKTVIRQGHRATAMDTASSAAGIVGRLEGR